MKNDCLFCAIAAGEIPGRKAYEDDKCLAFYDIAPQAPVHFLVIPKEHIASVAGIDDTNSAVVAHIFEVISRPRSLASRATAWCPTSASRRGRACRICTSMCSPVAI